MQNRRNIGIAHYMLISLFRTADSAKRTFKRIKELGIDYFDVGAMWTQRKTEYLWTDFEIEYDYNWPEWIAEAGLKTSSLLCRFDDIRLDPGYFIDMANAYQTDYIGSSSYDNLVYRDRGALDEYIREMNEIGRLYRKHGKYFYFHNHSLEFLKVDGLSETVMSYLLEHVDRDVVKLAFDPAWAQFSGADPLAYMRRAEGCFKILHLNDCGLSETDPKLLPDRMYERVLGEGNLELPAILDEADRQNAAFCILEMHSNYKNNDRLLSAELCMKYLTEKV